MTCNCPVCERDETIRQMSFKAGYDAGMDDGIRINDEGCGASCPCPVTEYAIRGVVGGFIVTNTNYPDEEHVFTQPEEAIEFLCAQFNIQTARIPIIKW